MGWDLPCDSIRPNLEILFSDVSQVVKGLRQTITKSGLAGPKRKILESVADYLYRSRTRMQYNDYLANGWPIGPGRKRL